MGDELLLYVTLGTLFPDQRLHREGRQEATLAWQGSALCLAQVLLAELSNIHWRIRHVQVIQMLLELINAKFTRCVLRHRPKGFERSELVQPSPVRSLLPPTTRTPSIPAHRTG